ncbi:MAG: PEP-CTERM sorting domain-containing protein [Planctomycetes bacterium]|nr:PEP-CTERM sorting domain-containing protein [Planctomycetota bacterium]
MAPPLGDSAAPAPEPATLALAALGAATAMLSKRTLPIRPRRG